MYTKPGIGTYLVDNNGRALYAFSGDDDGHSACLTNCASVWRPVMSGKVPMAADVTVAGAKLALAMRPDSTKQVMYNRILLYYYEPDVKPGETSGHNAGSFGGRFRLVSPAGKPLVDGR